jgi:hypothetical protein
MSALAVDRLCYFNWLDQFIANDFFEFYSKNRSAVCGLPIFLTNIGVLIT